ncbi:MAG: metal-sensing transcriptional repressor, partial [Fusobacteriaceae bacterium]
MYMKTDREKAVLMLKTCRGQIDATLKMIENGRYCMDIVNQILAA